VGAHQCCALTVFLLLRASGPSRSHTLEKEAGTPAYEVLSHLGEGSYAECVRIRQVDTGQVRTTQEPLASHRSFVSLSLSLSRARARAHVTTAGHVCAVHPQVFAGKLCPKRQLTPGQQRKFNRLADETKVRAE
jgi:hypothetical protein